MRGLFIRVQLQGWTSLKEVILRLYKKYTRVYVALFVLSTIRTGVRLQKHTVVTVHWRGLSSLEHYYLVVGGKRYQPGDLARSAECIDYISL